MDKERGHKTNYFWMGAIVYKSSDPRNNAITSTPPRERGFTLPLRGPLSSHGVPLEVSLSPLGLRPRDDKETPRGTPRDDKVPLRVA